MTNYEHIKAMSVEEMATVLSNFASNCATYCAFTEDAKCNSYGNNAACVEGIELWLASEVKK